MNYKAAIFVAVVALFISMNAADAGIVTLSGGQTIEVSHYIKYNVTLVAVVDSTTAAVKVDNTALLSNGQTSVKNEQDNIKVGQAKAVGGLIVLVDSVTDGSSTDPALDSAYIQYGGLKLTGGKIIEVRIYNNPAYNVSLITVNLNEAAINVNGFQQNFKKGDSKNMNGLQVYVTDIYDGSPTDVQDDPTKDYAVMEFGYSPPATCTDSDGGKDYYKAGYASGTPFSPNMLTSDICIKDISGAPLGYTQDQIERGVYEVFCDNSTIKGEVYVCPNGCRGGACINVSAPSITVISPASGEQWVAGKVYKISWESKNAPIDARVGIVRLYRGAQFLYDIVPSFSKNPASGSVQWAIPSNSITGNDFKIHIVLNTGPVGSESNIAEVWSAPFSILSATNTTQTCTDSDGGINYYVKGGADEECAVKPSSRAGYDFVNFCEGVNCYVFEHYCSGNSLLGLDPYNCPNGCKDGACVQADRCSLKPDPGLCKAHITRYYFDQLTGTCREFIWGGCGGVVPFETLKECEAACTTASKQQVVLGEKFELKTGQSAVVTDYRNMEVKLAGIALPVCPAGSLRCNPLYKIEVSLPVECKGDICFMPQPDILYFTETNIPQEAFGAKITMLAAYFDSAVFVVNTIVSAQRISITTDSPLVGIVGQKFSAQFSASGGVPPYKWSADGLPDGVELVEQYCNGPNIGACANNLIFISGTPKQAGEYKLRLTAKDSASNGGSETFLVPIKETEKRIFLSTDKYRYVLNEPVKIMATAQEDLGDLELTALVHRPDGRTDSVKLERLHILYPREGASIATGKATAASVRTNVAKEEVTAASIQTTTIILPPSYTQFEGVYNNTNVLGDYKIRLETDEKIEYEAARFTVIDSRLLEKYLILRDIDGYKFTIADVGREDVDGISASMYMASYAGVRGVQSFVIEFGSREDAEKVLAMLKEREFRIFKEEVINGNKVLVVSDSGNDIVLWTHRNLIIAVMYAPYVAVTTPQIVGTIEAAIPASVTGKSTASVSNTTVVGCVEDAKLCPDGSYVSRAPPTCDFAPCPVRKYCGSGSPNAECYCNEGETKEEFTPSCLEVEGFSCPAVIYYRCVSQQLPLPVIIAYLDKHPSDLSEEIKKEVTTEELLEIVFRLENLKKTFDELQRNAVGLSNYYSSVGDNESSEKFRAVAEMLDDAKNKVDEIKSKIRNNIDRPETIIDVIKEDIKELRTFLRRILLVMLGTEETSAGVSEAAQKTAAPLFGG